MPQKLNTKEFIKRAILKHNGLYEYDKTIYLNADSYVTIKCKMHGYFEQVASGHLAGRGCKDCGKKYRPNLALTKDEFIMRANLKHNNKYIYSKLNYTGGRNEITITCSEHGDFSLIAYYHLNGSGCKRCSLFLTQDEFLKRAINIHGERYGYDKLNYFDLKSKVTIKCSKHGYFEQRADAHINGSGCNECSVELVASKIRDTRDDFIYKAKLMHGELYNYINVNYKDAKTEVEIICPFNHVFWQVPVEHVRGSGCPKCYHFISIGEIAWLDYLSMPECLRHKRINNGKKYYRLDAFDPVTNTIYEYYGDFWHGNPQTFDQNKMNEKVGKTFGELYKYTIKRENELRALGYNLVVMWENDWKKIEKSMK